MAVTLKRLVGQGGAGMDDSMGHDNVYDVLKGLVDAHQQTVAQFNQLKADFDASSTPTSATDLSSYVTAE